MLPPLQSEIQGNMFTGTPSNQNGLVVSYNFAASEVTQVGTAAGELGKVSHLSAAYWSTHKQSP